MPFTPPTHPTAPLAEPVPPLPAQGRSRRRAWAVGLRASLQLGLGGVLVGGLGVGMGVGLSVGLSGCASTAALETPPAPPGPAQQIAPGVYMLPGAAGLPEPHNLGRVGNSGFIVGPQGVLVVDAGSSWRHGRAIIQRIREVTPLPLRALLITHVRQEFLFGANAFREAGVPVWMQRSSARLMAARCEGCLKTLKALVGDSEMQGSGLFKPDLEFDAPTELPLQTLTGRAVRVLHFGHSSGPGDVAVWDEASGALFAGGLLDHARVPDIQDARLPAWHTALNALRALPLRHTIPGHGAHSGPGLVDTVQGYLNQLDARVAELLRSGVGLADVVEMAELDVARDWQGYDIIHRRNVSIAYLRQEQAQLTK